LREGGGHAKDRVSRGGACRTGKWMLAAKGMGYDSYPMDGFDFEAVGKLIRLPADRLISFRIAICKGTKKSWPRPGQLGFDKVVIQNRF